MDVASFRIEEADFGETHQIQFHGEFDMAVATSAEEAISDALDVNRSVEIDLRPLTFIDSTGVRMMLTMCERARQMGKLLHLVPGPPNVHRVFEILELDDVLPFADPPDDETTA